MFFDFTIPKEKFSMGERAALALVHVSQVFIGFLKTIVEIAKVLFFALACAFTFNKSVVFQTQFKLALAGSLSSVTCIAISILGFFAPIHACTWKVESTTSITKLFIKDELTFVEGHALNAIYPQFIRADKPPV